MNSGWGGEVILLDWCAKAQYWYYRTLRKAQKSDAAAPRSIFRSGLALLDTPSEFIPNEYQSGTHPGPSTRSK